MKTYKEKIKTVKEEYQTFCNCCGQCIPKNTDTMADIRWKCEIHISNICHGPFPGQYSESLDYDICYACWKEKIKPLLTALEPNKVHKDHDSSTITVTP